EEAWRYAPTLDAVTTRHDALYLDSVEARANDVFAAGDLQRERPGKGRPDRYVSDPLDTRSAAWESEESAGGLTDQRGAMLADGKALFYHSPVFAGATDIAGFFTLSAWISLDQPDTDIAVAVYEIKADGSAVFLTSDSIRARYRNSLREARLVKPGAVERYDFKRFSFVARRIAKGSRLRLAIGPVNSMYAEKNYNAGGTVAQESGKDARSVAVALYHDAAHPSALSLPLAAASSVAAGK
ncbi:MAG TPA: CocE/NonD family hydrolase, partial [Dokdonella sp.]